MATKKATSVSLVRENLRKAAEDSGMTQEEIGLRMGFKKGGARQAVSRLLLPDSDYDPRISTLLLFAEAVKRPLKSLLP